MSLTSCLFRTNAKVVASPVAFSRFSATFSHRSITELVVVFNHTTPVFGSYDVLRDLDSALVEANDGPLRQWDGERTLFSEGLVYLLRGAGPHLIWRKRRLRFRDELYGLDV